MIINFIKKVVKMNPILTSTLSFVNKILMISTFSFKTAKHNAVL